MYKINVLRGCPSARGASGGMRRGAHQHTSCSPLKTRFKQKFKLKCA